MEITHPEARPGDTDDVLGHSRAHVAGRTLFQRLVATSRSLAPTLARLGLGLVILPHGLQKTIGWFGGHGVAATYAGFVGMGIPGPLAFLAICAESLGALALIFGLFTRVAALGIVAVMLGAIATVHAPFGFFMNWTGGQPGEGFEYHVLAIALGLVCLVAGGGRGSIDRGLMRWRPAPGGSVGPAVSTG